jgi:fatty acid desaturase
VAPTRFRAFRFTWNVLFGCPFLMPTFLYTDHRVHHTSQTYGTGGDAEYFPYVQRPFRLLVLSQLAIFILPLLPIIRFGLLGPLSLLRPKLRSLVWERASSLGALSPSYRRAAPDADERRAARWQEVVCSLVVFGLFAALWTGAMTWTAFGLILAVYLFAMMVNNFRVYAAHRYVSTGEPMTFLDQMLDSTTIPTVPAALWAPLGMRYHALHHLFPAMPYHAMRTAHRRLMRQLPPNSPYHQTVVRSLPESILNLIRATRAHANLAASPVGK